MDRALVQQIRRRAAEACEYCRMPQQFDEIPFEVEHVVARQHGGKTVPPNLALACFPCNRHKGPNIAGIDPDAGKLTALYHPRRHTWLRHFRFVGPLIVGRTPIGRTTVAVLAMNQPLRVRLRQELIDEGVFPVWP